jgi:1,4-alpha-glucan branching enzyme
MSTSSPPRAKRTDGTALIDVDPWLEPYADKLRRRYSYLQRVRKQFDATGGLLGQVSQGHHYFGFNRGELWGKPGVWYREWAPAALQLRVIGDFNNWDRMGHPMVRNSSACGNCFSPTTSTRKSSSTARR